MAGLDRVDERIEADTQSCDCMSEHGDAMPHSLCGSIRRTVHYRQDTKILSES